MRTYECPSCGAAVKFASSAAIFAVCDHCRSMVVRGDIALESIGTMAQLPEDLSPLQIGARGEWAGQPFTLLGRVRLAWDEGSWTEWYSVFGDGRRGWLAETQGFFTLTYLNESEAAPQRIQTLKSGTTVDFARRRWQVVDGKEATCLGSEGELPFVAKPGVTRYSVDLAGPGGAFGSLEDTEGRVTFYEGIAARFAELKFTNLRPIPGWSDNTSSVPRKDGQTLSCPQCGAPVSLRAPGQTMAVVCGSCQTVLDATKPQVQVIQRAYAEQERLAPVLPLGIRGNFYGNAFEIVGYMVRSDPYSRWAEYLLFNPWHGFIWLVNYRGHWSLVWRLLSPPRLSRPNVARWEKQAYALFAESETRVYGVLGEFYWRVTRGEVSNASDFVAPPQILSRETYPGFNEETWSAGEYKKPREIVEAFGLKERLPEPEGPYLNEPNPYREASRKVLRWSAVALIFLCVIQAGSFVIQRPKIVFSGDFVHRADGTPEGENTTPTFHLSEKSQPVFVDVRAPVTNSWIAVDAELVNATTGDTRSLATEVSYYSGYDTDGAWSEGSRQASADAAAVPAGDYFVRFSTTADPAAQRLSYALVVRAGGIFWSNFIAALSIILLYPGWLLWRRFAFEQRRWAESDFLAFGALTSKQDDDD